MKPTLFKTLIALLFVAMPGATALAQAWPTKPIHLLIPYPPGGQTDIVGRWLGSKLSPALGQPIVIENKAGAQGIIAMSAAKNAAADGYNFVYSNVSITILNKFAHAKLPYDPIADFDTVTLMGYTPLGMAVPPSLGVSSVEELVRHVKANPGKTTFASFGNGSTAHMYGEMFNSAAGLDMLHVPYKGTAPAMTDVIAGRATVGYIDFSTMGSMIQAGKLRVLAVTGPKRWPAHPDIPTFTEIGYALDMAGWAGIMAPKGTPRAIIERMSVEINRIIQSAEGTRDLLQKGGIIAVGTTPSEFVAMIRRDMPRWGEAFARSGVKPQQ